MRSITDGRGSIDARSIVRLMNNYDMLYHNYNIAGRHGSAMAATDRDSAPLVQRLYDRIWLLALAALVFWALSYVLWGLADIFSVPAG